MKSYLDCCFMVVMLPLFGYTQTTNFSYVDPAQAFNKLLIEKNSNSFYRIGNYRVIGSPFLFGGSLPGVLYLKGVSSGTKCTISYNTYDQQLEYQADSKMTAAPPDVDSFKVLVAERPSEILFYSGEMLGLPKTNLQVVFRGYKTTLYKRYFSELDVVSTNYVEGDLREFGLNYEYYYTDSSTKPLKAKKIKAQYTNVVKEFKNLTGLKDVIPANFNDNPEANLIKAFRYINEN